MTKSSRIQFINNATVWSTEKEDGKYQINYLQSGIEDFVIAEKLILATGAYDRSLPFPGWELPGVMTPGAAQSLLKGHGVIAGKRIVVAGTGPFLLPVATSLAEAGAEIVGLLEAHSPMRWLLSAPALIGNFSKIPELAYYRRTLKNMELRRNLERQSRVSNRAKQQFQK